MHELTLDAWIWTRNAWIFCEAWNLLAMHEFSARYGMFSRCMNYLRGMKSSRDAGILTRNAWILTRNAWINSRCMNWLSMHEYELAMHEFFARHEIFSRCMNFLRGMKSSRDAEILTRNAWILTLNAWIDSRCMNMNSQCMNFLWGMKSSRDAWIFCEVWNLLAMHELSARYEIFSRCRNIDSQCMNINSKCMN